jgi:hypothetical protein
MPFQEGRILKWHRNLHTRINLLVDIYNLAYDGAVHCCFQQEWNKVQVPRFRLVLASTLFELVIIFVFATSLAAHAEVQ